MVGTVDKKWLAVVGIVTIIGVGGTIGLAESAGASNGAAPTLSGPITTAKFTFNVSLSGLSPSALAITGSGQADFSKNTAALSVKLPAVVAARIPGGSASPETINAVLSGGTVYLEVPALASKVGVPWISVALPPKATAALPGVFTKIAAALGDVDRIAQFAEARHAEVTSLGGNIVDGVKVEGTKIIATRSHSGMTRTLTTTLWADSSDHLVQATVSASGATKKGPLGLTATVDAAGYGSPVTVTVPAPSKVKAIPFSTIAMFFGKVLHHHHRL